MGKPYFDRTFFLDSVPIWIRISGKT